MPHPFRPKKRPLSAQPGVTAQARRGARVELSAAAEAWVRRTHRKMTLDEKLGQLLMIPFFGEFTSVASASFRELERHITANHIGGLMLETQPGPLGLKLSQAFPVAALINLLQKRAAIPLLVAGDFERGTAFRLDDGTAFPHAMAIAATGRLADAYTVGRVTALEAGAMGAPWIFAPVADLNSNPDNPIINVRSFGEDPRRVAELVTAFLRGVEENGGLATVKHFPGHGNTSVDSHIDLPTITSNRRHLNKVELVPFRAAIAAGVSSVMTAHIAVPALDSQNAPATLSEKISNRLLRRKMGFDGLIVTDALSMGGVAKHYSPGEAAVRSILAGTDVLLLSPEPDAALAALRLAIRSGRIPESRIDSSVLRILRAKARLGLSRGRTVNLDALPASFGQPEFSAAALDIADRGITLLRDNHPRLPLDATKQMRVLLVAIAGDPDRLPGRAFEAELRWRVDSLRVMRADTRFSSVTALTPSATDDADLVVIALFVRVTDRKGSVGLPEDQIAAVRHFLSIDKPVIVACFGSPYVIGSFPEASTWLAAFSNSDVAQRAAARAIFGQTTIGGRIPVGVPGVLTLGTGLDVAASPMRLAIDSVIDSKLNNALSRAHDLLADAAAKRAFPGGVVAVGYHGRLATRAFGKMTFAPGGASVASDTIYDVASLTKPVVTATLAAQLVEAGSLDLDAPLSRSLPEWCASRPTGTRAQVTARHLLTHTSGLPAHKDYFKSVRTRDKVVARALREPLRYQPGTQSVYSDIGFILLDELIQRLTGMPLDRLAQERIFAPLGMSGTFFNPARNLHSRIAPTEKDVLLRHRILKGEVHDENAWVMGGVAGHAGLFTTAADLAAFCQMMLNGGIYAHQRLLQRHSVETFTAPAAITKNTRTLGWNVPTANSSSGHHFSARSFGHTGFTGTSIWIDPDRELFVVLLTNRVHPTRENNEIQKVRPAVHDTIVRALNPALK